MARVSRVLALDIGASGIKLAEFSYGSGNSVTLLGFDYRPYDDELNEDTRGFVIGSLLSDMVRAGGYQAKKALISISGQYALTRFVPLPPVAEEESRVRQIVEFEARQNVPFPMDEVIWDYQLIANPEADELEVMFVVIKNEIVEEITGAVQSAGLEPVLVDVAPAACYNAARANLVGEDECAMVLNLGDRSTNLLFADRQQFFARTIPIAGHSISQQIAKEFGMDFARAEELKKRHGFVALGGAYAEPESEVAASVSKIVRNVMTRLHGEINRSIGVYRAQQKGRKPQKLYLTGGSSIMGFTDRFFQDKLGIPVEYLNPFQCVQLGPGVDTQRLQNVAHMFSEVVGLGLRYRGQCAVEVSLMPESITRQIAMRRRTPYLVASAAAFLLMMMVVWLAFAQKNKVYRELVSRSSSMRDTLQTTRQQIVRKMSDAEQQRARYRFFEKFLAGREQLPKVFNVMESLKPSDLWLTSVTPVIATDIPAGGGGQDPREMDAPAPGLFGAAPVFGAGAAATQVATTAPQVEIEKITITGFIIQGHSVKMTDKELAFLMPAPPPPVEEKAVNTEEQPVPPPDAPLGGDGGGQGPEATAAASPPPPGPFGPPQGVADTEPAPAPAPAVTATVDAYAGLLPEELYQRRLQEHSLFDRERTEIVSYQTGSGVENQKAFTMRVVLVEPITVAFE